jgi:hypothetical protein
MHIYSFAPLVANARESRNMPNPDPLASDRARLIALMTAVGKPPIQRDRDYLIAQMPESVLEEFIAYYSPTLGATSSQYVW